MITMCLYIIETNYSTKCVGVKMCFLCCHLSRSSLCKSC